MKLKTAMFVVILTAAAILFSLMAFASCGNGPDEEGNVVINENNIVFKWDAVEGADEYKIYHGDGRYSYFSLESTQTECKYTGKDKYGYYRVDAIGGGNVLQSEFYAYDFEVFGPNTYVYSPSDDAEKINGDIDEKFEELEAGQFSTERFGVLFKSGEYPDVRMQMGYYTTASGLGLSPEDVTLGYFNVNAQWFNGNATHNFWRGIENMTIDGDVQWAVSQATSFRRMNVLGGMRLDDGGWSSGGYIADSRIAEKINSGGQQQWFTRNSEFEAYQNASWNRVFVGCDGQYPSGKWPDTRNTIIETADEISEKPFLTFDGNEGYGVFIPKLRTNAKGVSWDSDEIEGERISLDEFYVARVDRDSADTINAALKKGKHLLFTPGIYKLDKPLNVVKENTVILGIGLATLQITDKNTDALMKVADVGGVNISGLLFDAGSRSKNLLVVGEKKTDVSHASNKIHLSDLFFRVGGAEKKATSADVCVTINTNDVIIDHFWVWRADHSYGVGWNIAERTDRYGDTYVSGNVTKNGIVVNGDNVTAYALMVEHFHEYQTLWNGENGRTYFYQSEAPYDAVQEDWMSHDGAVEGYASYKVADGVKKHSAYGIGVYGYANGCVMSNGIEASTSDDVYFEHIFTVMLSNSKPSSVTNVINDVGGSVVTNGQFDRTIEYYYGGQRQTEGK